MAWCRTGSGEFKFSNDPAFVDKLRDIAGLYVKPPEHAIVLSVDEKLQIQGPLPMKKGQPQTRIHDYRRNDTATLFAALKVLEGTVIGQNMDQEFIAFLDTVERQLPEGRDVHVIPDTHSTHKTDTVRAWLDRASQPNVPFHAHLVLLAERGGGVRRETDEAAPEARHLQLRHRVRGGHPPVHRGTRPR